MPYKLSAKGVFINSLTRRRPFFNYSEYSGAVIFKSYLIPTPCAGGLFKTVFSPFGDIGPTIYVLFKIESILTIFSYSLTFVDPIFILRLKSILVC